MSVLTGIILHAIGAGSASLCYTPQKKTKQWSWQTYWLAQAVVCWLVLPLLVAWITIPKLTTVLQEAPRSAMLSSFVLGAAYGIGGTAFGIAIRYIGFSLTYAFSIGISCVLGTLLPPIIHGQFMNVFNKIGGIYILAGVAVGIIGIILCGISGRMKEKDLSEIEKTTAVFDMKRGLPLCILAGILSAFFGLSLDQGAPIAEIANKYGAGVYSGNVIYIFSNTGAFFSTLIYCLYLHKKHQTFKEFVNLSGSTTSFALPVNYILAIITGTLWYCQFFFYGLGHVRLGAYQFTSWAIHMIILVLFSSVVGLIMKEWVFAKPKTIRILTAALLVLLFAVIILTYGNYLGS
ncbi:L-rhamnose/proton symporter RhaT [Pedobacter sp. Du54]|uniref:L-rhamnose/proton symporter RhaT n=1 Tax=Pedobacter anseongensis TaxID=3133439 RepID=UPI0030A804E2